MSAVVEHRSGLSDGATVAASDDATIAASDSATIAGFDGELDERVNTVTGDDQVAEADRLGRTDQSTEAGEPRSDGAGDAPAEPPESEVVDAVAAPADVVQDGPVATPAQLRVDFGAHLEANYQRLVAQLYAMTLDSGEAHEAVQDAYSRAWRNWAVISSSPDPTGWIRRVAVRSTIRSWRQVLRRFGIGRRGRVVAGADARTGALLSALARLTPAERRAVVLFHMVGASRSEIAALEQVLPGTVRARLSRARQVVTEGMAEVLPDVLGLAVEPYTGAHEIDQGVHR